MMWPYTMKILLCSLLAVVAQGSDDFDPPKEISEFDRVLKEENPIVVLFTVPCCTCTDCVEAEVLLGGMSKELEDHLGAVVVRLKEPLIKARYGVKKVPTLIYIRDNKTAIYDGKFDFDSVFDWLQDNRNPATVELNDSSFEHLTQASSGATTGDWLVVFHDGACCKNRELIQLENAGIKLKNSVNVASVDVRVSPETKDRFKISHCPEIIFFRHQKMYRFSLSDVTINSLRRFAEGFYKNSKTERVPLPQSGFDKFRDATIDFINLHWNAMLAIGVAVSVGSAILLVIALIMPAPRKKSD